MCRKINIHPETTDISTSSVEWTHNLCNYISRNLVLWSIVLGWILIYLNWCIDRRFCEKPSGVVIANTSVTLSRALLLNRTLMNERLNEWMHASEWLNVEQFCCCFKYEFVDDWVKLKDLIAIDWFRSLISCFQEVKNKTALKEH